MSGCSTNNSSVLPIGNTGTGTTGATGATGATGTSVIFNNTAGQSTTSGTIVSLLTHTLADSSPATVNSLLAIGDSLEILATFSLSAGVAAIELWIGGALTMNTLANGAILHNGVSTAIMRATATRTSSTTLFIQFDIKYSGGVDFTSLGGQSFYTPAAIVNDLDSSTNVIDMRGAVTGGTLTLRNLLILKYKI